MGQGQANGRSSAAWILGEISVPEKEVEPTDTWQQQLHLPGNIYSSRGGNLAGGIFVRDRGENNQEVEGGGGGGESGQ